MCLAENIKYLRIQKGYSQDYVAEQLGYKSFTTIQKWESGVSEPSIKTLRKLSEMFDIDIDDLTNKKIYLGEDKQSDTYYLNNETKEIAQEIYENKELRSLFDAARDLPPERLRAHIDFIKSLKAQEKNNDNEGC